MTFNFNKQTYIIQLTVLDIAKLSVVIEYHF